MEQQKPKRNIRRTPNTSSQQERSAFRTGMSAEAIKHALLDNLCFNLGKVPLNATKNDWYHALAYTVRDRMMQQWIKTLQNFTEDMTIVSYLSAEFLTGPQLGINIINLDIYDAVFQAVRELGLNIEELIEHEKEPGLGNGGIGMLASCSLDSLATLEIPAIGYGVRYEFGSFDQEIRDGWQVEMTNKWLQHGNPWEIPRPEFTYKVNLGGHTESYYDEQNLYRVRWVPKFSIKGIAYDTPVSGYKVNTTNLLRLWKSEAVESFDFEAFNVGDYFSAVNEKVASEAIGKILYPHDEPYVGKQLRLAQHYFFVSCSLQDMIRLHLMRWKNINTFSSSFAVQLNDTPPSIAVVELMRLLIDEYLVSWDKAWYITQNTFSYTHHTLLPEDLEKWPLPLFAGILPRHLEIIYEINRRFLDEIWLKYPDDSNRLARLSLIEEGDQKYVRMAHLANLGSHIINGVAEPCSESLKKRVFRDFYELYPEKVLNVTSGVTPRRWIVLSNPRLAKLITDAIGDRWIRSMAGEIKELEQFADNIDFRKKWHRVKYENKSDLVKIILDRIGISVNPDSLFDIQVKRFNEHKRHHLNILHIITLYNRIKKNPQLDIPHRTCIFGGHASPGYFTAKLIIKLINSVADIVNNDPDVAGRLSVVFFPNINVKNGHRVYPAADLSEHISLAGREVSATGNMKFSMNGALTIGTVDGANIEISEAVGAENFFTFGLTAEEVSSLKAQGYKPRDYYHANAELREAIDLISSGFFSKRDPDLFKPLIDSLLSRDEHMLLADYQSYIDCQDRISTMLKDQETWTKMSILTVARMGKFSSDRSIQEYCDKIWLVKPFRSDAENI
jgi:starch phosphorylase